MYTTIASIQHAGFTGFHPITRLWQDYTCIPRLPGIYVVAQQADELPVFVDLGTGGLFKGRDPNYSVVDLANRWIAGCSVLYVGKAGGRAYEATLQSRIRQYLDFGRGKPVGHRGGRAIWQLANHPQLLVAWRPITEGDPTSEESAMIRGIKTYYGKRPFANRRG